MTGAGLAALLALAVIDGGASAQEITIGSGSVVETVLKLRPGEYVWVLELAPDGPLLLIVNTNTASSNRG